jgi:hypothetical protein
MKIPLCLSHYRLGFLPSAGGVSVRIVPTGCDPDKRNTTVGLLAALFNAGSDNTAIGAAALGLNFTGTSNTAIGASALQSNNSGIDNTGVGSKALFAKH